MGLGGCSQFDQCKAKRTNILRCVGRRQTRGVEKCSELIEQMIKTFSSHLGNDTMGIPLLDSDHVWYIWGEQKRHLNCIQDPDGVLLYRQPGTRTKGGDQLPVYRCASGSTSLESFHNHIARFIPGKNPFELMFRPIIGQDQRGLR